MAGAATLVSVDSSWKRCVNWRVPNRNDTQQGTNLERSCLDILCSCTFILGISYRYMAMFKPLWLMKLVVLLTLPLTSIFEIVANSATIYNAPRLKFLNSYLLFECGSYLITSDFDRFIFGQVIIRYYTLFSLWVQQCCGSVLLFQSRTLVQATVHPPN